MNEINSKKNVLGQLAIVLHNILPTTSPLADFNDEIVLSVIPKPITRFFAPLIIGKGAYEMNKGKSDEFCMKNESYHKCNN